MQLTVSVKDVAAFSDFIDNHPRLTNLSITFGKDVPLEPSWQILSRCTALISLYRADHCDFITQPTSQPTIPLALFPMLRSFSWKCNFDKIELPKENHQLTYFQGQTFPNNVRRHRTLVDLHTDWSGFFWPN